MPGATSEARTSEVVGSHLTRRQEPAARAANPVPDRWIASGVGALAFLVFRYTLLPGVGYSGDTAKWQFLGEVGGVPHASGYPLYLLINKAFVSVVPWGSLAWRANLLSAILGAVTVGLLFWLLRLLGVSPGVAAAASLVFAFTRTFWTQAVIAEVYTLHLALMAATFCCLARWRSGGTTRCRDHQDVEAGDVRCRLCSDSRWLVAGLAIYALSFGNHLGTVLALPGVIYVVASDWRRAASLRNAAWLGAVTVVTAAQYWYVVHLTRVGAYVERPIEGVDDVLSYLTGGYFKARMFTFTPWELVTDRVPLTAHLAVDELSVLLTLVVVGAWVWLRPTRWDSGDPRQVVAVAVAGWGCAAWLFALNFDVPEVDVFLLPAYFVTAVFLGLGLAAVLAWLRQRYSGQGLVSGALVALLIAAPLAIAIVNYPRASQRGNLGHQERLEATLTAAGHDAVLLSGTYDDSEYLWYFLLGEGLGDKQNLAMVHGTTASQVTDYFDANRGPVAQAAGEVTTRNRQVGNPALFAVSEDLADDLRAADFLVTRVAPSAWAIELQR